MSERKTFKIDKDEFALLQRAKAREGELAKEQRIYDRKNQLELNKIRIIQHNRQISDKKAQIETGNLRETHEGFKDGVKPVYWLENEIDEIEHQIDILKDSIKKLEEEQKKDGGLD
ncbi:MAG: hypothetical protein ACTSX6_04735 [Candidatus Heimdallarchaeaceae archaeon]